MELLDRYLEAVKKHLPWQRQDDIIAELRANLESQLEEKEDGLGRPLTHAEMEAWIKSLGSPIQAAAGYQPQQYLIGPAIFPIYRYVLRLVCAWSAIVYAVVTVVQLFAEKGPMGTILLRALLQLPYAQLITAAWVTLAFVAIEWGIAHRYVSVPGIAAPPAAWTPAGLPPMKTPCARGKKPRSLLQAVIEAFASFFSLAWLLLIPHYPFLLMGPGIYYFQSSPYVLAPVLIQFFWCVVALNVIQLGWRVENLWQGSWMDPHPLMQIGFKTFGLIPLMILVNAPGHAMLLLRHAEYDQAQYGATLDTINVNIHRGLMVVTAIVVLQLGWDVIRMNMDAWRRRAAAMR
jgi:hypothetical protein